MIFILMVFRSPADSWQLMCQLLEDKILMDRKKQKAFSKTNGL